MCGVCVCVCVCEGECVTSYCSCQWTSSACDLCVNTECKQWPSALLNTHHCRYTRILYTSCDPSLEFPVY